MAGDGVATVYEGTWHRGKRHGQGSLQYSSKAIYVGNFEHNYRSGQGKIIYESGNWCVSRHSAPTFLGPCPRRALQLSGRFCRRSPCNIVCAAHPQPLLPPPPPPACECLSVNVPSSNPSAFNLDPSLCLRYEGEWKGDLRHGAGTMMWKAADERYVGQWVEGIQDGHGEHVWEQQRFPGSQYPQQNRYVGHFSAGQRDGYGEFFYASGAEFRGGWQKDLKHGSATYIDVDGFVAKNTYVDDVCVPTEEAGSVPGKDVYGKTAETPFHFDLTDLPGGSDPAQIKEVFVVLLRHITEIQAVYKKYSVLGLGSDHTTCRMDRLRVRFLRALCPVLSRHSASASYIRWNRRCCHLAHMHLSYFAILWCLNVVPSVPQGHRL